MLPYVRYALGTPVRAQARRIRAAFLRSLSDCRGQQQQTLGQQELNQAYQQFLNQANWPYQMLNIRESALSNSPYNMVNATTVPQANMAAQGFGATLSGIGSLGSLLSGNSGTNNAPFGGATMQGSH